MQRIQLPEFIDFDWFPSWLRTSMTHLIVVVARLLGASQVLATLASRVLQDGRIDQIIDLGSGAGGPMPEVIRILRAEQETADVRLIMTDRHPNLEALEALNVEGQAHIRYLPEPVDAMDLASAPPGLKTMVNAFHHLPPDDARHFLAAAQAARQPLLIYEMGQPILPLWLWWLTLPVALVLGGVMVFFMTPFVRPLTLRQLFFTYVIPIIPIFYAWDGQASMPRLYSLSDMDELLDGLPADGYRWEKGQARTAAGRKIGTYLIGLP